MTLTDRRSKLIQVENLIAQALIAARNPDPTEMRKYVRSAIIHLEEVMKRTARLRKCEKCSGDGPCKWDDRGQRYLCASCHSNPSDSFFISEIGTKKIRAGELVNGLDPRDVAVAALKALGGLGRGKA